MSTAIPVSHIEFNEGGNTLWVHNDQGATVLRIKLERGVFRTQKECANICSHADIYVRAPASDEPQGNDVTICLADDACEPWELKT